MSTVRLRQLYKLAAIGVVGLAFASRFQENIYSKHQQFILWGPQFDLTIGSWTTSALESQLKSNFKFKKKTSEEAKFTQDLVDYLMQNSILKDVYQNGFQFIQDPIKRTWKVHIINSNVVNAMATMDGQIFVFEGLLKNNKSVDETALVLSHEISHVLLRHVPHQLSTTGFAAFLLAIFLSAANIPFLNEYGMGIYNLIFAKTMSRKEELEADTYGVKFASHCGFNANKGAKFFSKANSNFLERILSTHPSDEQRIQNIEELAKQYSDYLYHEEEKKEAIQKFKSRFQKLKETLKQRQEKKENKTK